MNNNIIILILIIFIIYLAHDLYSIQNCNLYYSQENYYPCSLCSDRIDTSMVYANPNYTAGLSWLL
jgi:hypothetical protein